MAIATVHDNSKTFLHWHLYDLNRISFRIQGRALFLLSILFSIILLLSLLFFYMNRNCHRQNFYLPTNAVAIIRSVGVDGLDAATINSLPAVLHSSLSLPKNADAPITTRSNNDEQGNECSICLSIFEDEEMVKVLPICHHTYHSVCVDKWLTSRSSCPLCRASLAQLDIPVVKSTLPS